MWYVRSSSGKEVGPFDAAKILRLIDSGKLSKENLAKRSSGKLWLPIGEISEIFPPPVILETESSVATPPDIGELPSLTALKKGARGAAMQRRYPALRAIATGMRVIAIIAGGIPAKTPGMRQDRHNRRWIAMT